MNECLLNRRFQDDFFVKFLFQPVSLDGARLGAADDCSWQAEGVPEHVLVWGKVVRLEVVPEITCIAFVLQSDYVCLAMYFQTSMTLYQQESYHCIACCCCVEFHFSSVSQCQ